ncbi:MAG: ASCH domain-containing protein [Candidatus Korarchaeum sp.]|nr:ASCH domain-containing protein [Candidatus Korarchaeum sp.]
MRVLRFKIKYKDAIASGRKKATLRMESDLKPGDLVTIEIGRERLGEALVKCVEEVRVDDLSDELAREDGFESLRELLIELKSIYGDKALRSGTKFKLIRLELRGGKGELSELRPTSSSEGG